MYVGSVGMMRALPSCGVDTTTVTVPADLAEVVQQICVADLVAFTLTHREESSMTVGETTSPSRFVPLIQIWCPPAVEPLVASSPISVIVSDWASKR